MEASPDLSVRENWGSGTAGDGSVRTMEGQLTGFPTDAEPEPEEKWSSEQICLVPPPRRLLSATKFYGICSQWVFSGLPVALNVGIVNFCLFLS